MTLVAKTFAAAVNHLLAREAWAHDLLAPYAGRVARLTAPFVDLTVVVLPQGAFAPAADGATPNVTLTLLADAPAEFVKGGRAAAMRRVKIDGDAEFAELLGKLAERLRWEPEEDLARLFGDAAAHRAMRGARECAVQLRRSGRNLVETTAEYLLDENPQLVRRVALDAFRADVARLRDDLARLEKRAERLERSDGALRGRCLDGRSA